MTDIILDNETEMSELESFLSRPSHFGLHIPNKPKAPRLSPSDALDAAKVTEHLSAVNTYNEQNSLYEDELAEYQAEINEVFVFWKERLFDEFSSDLNKKQLDLIYDRAYDDDHSDGYHAVRYAFEEYAEFAENILKLANE